MTTVEYLLKKLETDELCIEQAKEFEKEMLFQCWKASEQNMRSQFSSSAYKNITFDTWFKQFKKK
jgi:hypothetical protein